MVPQKRSKIPAEETMSVSDAARYLSLSSRAIYRMVGELPAIRVGGRWRFRVRDLDNWILKHRTGVEALPEPLDSAGDARLFPYMDLQNIFLDAPQTTAADLIRSAVVRARLTPNGGSEEEAKDRICEAILEREKLCSTALHPDAAFPHPRDPEKCALAEHQIVVVRARRPVDFGEAHGYRPRIAIILLARTAAVQLVWEARLSHLLHREGLARRLLDARNECEIYDVFAGAGEGALSGASPAAGESILLPASERP
jgi:excisionase family DNA binding protein